jgi:hypothetical protein
MLLSVGLLAGCRSAPVTTRVAAPLAVMENVDPNLRIEPVRWGQFAGAYRISNGRVEAIVVPEIRRVIAFNRVGEANVFWTDDQVAPGKPKQYTNFGGEKAWLWPQERFKGTWPPPMDVNQIQYNLLSARDALIMESDPFPGLETRIRRTIWIDSQDRLIIDSELEGSGSAGWGLWTIAQLPRGDAVLAKMSAGAASSAVLLKPMKPEEILEIEEIDSGIAKLSAGGDISRKAGLDANRLAVLSGNKMVMIEQELFRQMPEHTFLPGQRAQVFVTDLTSDWHKQRPFVELEFTAPVQPVNHAGPPVKLRTIHSIHTISGMDEAKKILRQ